MKHLLDTDTCIFIIRKRPESVFEILRRQELGTVGISSITHSELCHGAIKSQQPEKNMSALEAFTAPLEILPYDAAVGRSYGQVRSELEKRGTPIGSMDLLIAAHALSLDLTLVTNNTREFKRVKDLKLANWIH
ncbi:MAG: type II toxin-antitoxin system VapC family toxin [Okeania sp. SIO3B3]|nr:type II toxin-antitoxin system VapC family toxin [Okeania sp. SIO3B3]